MKLIILSFLVTLFTLAQSCEMTHDEFLNYCNNENPHDYQNSGQCAGNNVLTQGMCHFMEYDKQGNPHECNYQNLFCDNVSLDGSVTNTDGETSPAQAVVQESGEGQLIIMTRRPEMIHNFQMIDGACGEVEGSDTAKQWCYQAGFIQIGNEYFRLKPSESC